MTGPTKTGPTPESARGSAPFVSIRLQLVSYRRRFRIMARIWAWIIRNPRTGWAGAALAVFIIAGSIVGTRLLFSAEKPPLELSHATPGTTTKPPPINEQTTAFATVVQTTQAAPTVTKESGNGKVRAVIDPQFTQNAVDPLEVTFAYSASITNGALPTGTLSLAISAPGQVSVTGGCTINVGGSVYGGDCTVKLPYFGDWQVTTTYSGASSGSTATEVVSIPGASPTTSTTGDVGLLTTTTAVSDATTTSSQATTTSTLPTPALSWGNWSIAGGASGSGPITMTIPTATKVTIYPFASFNGAQIGGGLDITASPGTYSMLYQSGNYSVSNCFNIPSTGAQCQVTFNSAGTYTITMTYLPLTGYATTQIQQRVKVG